MEEEYVSREKVKSWKVYSNERHEYVVPIGSINLVPVADVKPVKYGEWIVKPDFMMDVSNQCSVCGKEFILIDGTAAIGEYHYCPNCGAEMKEGKGWLTALNR